MASWIPNRFSPSASANTLDDETLDNGSESNSDTLQRTSSISMRFRNAGGVNSIDNFARSWQRAARFPEVVPRRSSFTFAKPDASQAAGLGSADKDLESKERQPLLPGHLGSAGTPSDGVIEDDRHEISWEEAGPSRRDFPGTGLLGTYEASSLSRSFGTSYGTISSRVSDATRQRAIQFHNEQLQSIDRDQDTDREPLLIRQVQREDGTKENVIVGQSTVPQTIFNSVNVLIGVGLLSLPLGIKHAGWLIGLLFLSFAAASTAYTARILAKCLDVDYSLVTYADLAYISFGRQARIITSLLFCLELIGACVALVVLFADSLDVLIPGLSVVQWKIICGIILIPLNFIPLRFLSVTSILGILSCTSIVIIVVIDGFIKPNSPGSLHQPARTSIFPDNWATVPLSFGLIMSPWGGHGVFPNIYRDMRHPFKYGRSLLATYIFTYSLDCAMAVIGWLMFGDAVRDEITANILLTAGYPRGFSICIIIFIAIIPITKVPLNCRPLIATVEILSGLNSQNNSLSLHASGPTKTAIRVAKFAVRIFVVVVIVFISIVFPSFDRIMALMGSCLCFTICIILPLAFYLKIFGKEIPVGERIVDWVLLVMSSIMAVIGTVWAFLPKESNSAN
ncbi:hypothetical protein VTN77DRAFT_904 [Rasamsonia byssochlamydoides]|uniref:uncharacterized protein n=1 Tax=Rasamsonia byssochlamydoides TaxID=89139 RepID=UPI0037446B03